MIRTRYKYKYKSKIMKKPILYLLIFALCMCVMSMCSSCSVYKQTEVQERFKHKDLMKATFNYFYVAWQNEDFVYFFKEGMTGEIDSVRNETSLMLSPFDIMFCKYRNNK